MLDPTSANHILQALTLKSSQKMNKDRSGLEKLGFLVHESLCSSKQV